MPNSGNLKDLIDLDLLQNIQDRLSEITGLAFNIVDFKGNPINNYSNFCNFCKKMRSTKEGMKLCYEANAHAGLEAAIRQEPYVFKCPAGLVDVATPIIMNNNYLGAIFFGQVKTNNEKFLSIKESNYCSKMFKKNPTLKKDYDEIKYIDYNKIESIFSLVKIVVNQLVEKSVLNSIQEDVNFNNIKLIKEQEERIKLEKQLKVLNLKLMQTPMKLNFEFNILNSISNLALIENAPKTQEMIYSLSDLIRYTSKNIGCEVTIGEEIKNIITYLKIQSSRFGKRIKYKVDIDENIKKIKILPMILLFVIEYSITNGLSPKKEGGTINIKGYILENDAIITIKDDGIGISENELFLILNGKCENEVVGMNIYNINEILANYYGKTYKADIRSKVNIGTTVRLKFPLSHMKENNKSKT
ncbi:sensor histidine kinase [Clostridium uliginosum]|uniref:Histidine kinase-, DNA gyrase B-, and HSP90-like ATPase n=1 Tax=Clostridium uliginosum TaxID=119641 RepID=A0A1I1N146_9CLOT|nr:PocR ligand-binding domain-containing protein [Clostridium uliginosum]SFC91066.1 Histidine kinase-, DNA gyrase B-, and HSP90-like ATPase [Clostridium uliginosum]